MINFLAVVVAALVYFFLGALWYSPVLFAKPWMQAIKFNEKKNPNPLPAMIGTVIVLLVSLSILSWLLRWMNVIDLAGAIWAGAAISLASMIPAILISELYEKRSWVLLLINTGYHLVGTILAGIILTLWR